MTSNNSMTLEGFSVRASNLIYRYVHHQNGEFRKKDIVEWVENAASMCYGYGEITDNEVRMRLGMPLKEKKPRCEYCGQHLRNI